MTLAQVNTAIETILTEGQSFTLSGITYTAASLPALQALRSEMMAQTSRTTRPLFRAMNFRSMGYGSESVTDDDIVKTVYP